MTRQTDFTPEEWALVQNAPTAAAGAVIQADMTFVSAVKEVLAVSRAGVAAREKYKHNELLLDVLPAGPRMKGDPVPVQAKSPFDGITQDQGIEKVREAVAVVQAKATPSEAAEYKALILELSELAANASGEGFLGTGKKVSDKEAAFLAKLKAALG
jgi:hypothetical protein